MRRLIVFACVLVVLTAPAWAGGSKEAAGSSTRGKYLAAQGMIVPADQVMIDSYIASIDYHYPKPTQGIGVSIHTGHRQISSAGQEEIIHIGIQGPVTPFEELTPMNLVFVIDHSGSMASSNKLDWVKRSFETFIKSVRDKDYVALVIFDSSAQVVFPSTRMDGSDKRTKFRWAVESIHPAGGTNLLDGLKLGYEQAMTNYRSDYTNRVLFLTDGNDNQDHVRQMLEMADSYREMGVNVSTIGVGTSFDLKLMNDLAARGGGSSRFISDMKEMNEMFGSDLDRMLVPAARDVEMRLDLNPGVALVGTWGYQNTQQGSAVSYTLSTLHHRDYETILARVRVAASRQLGLMELGRFSLTYRDLEGGDHALGPFPITVDVVSSEAPVSGYSDATVLQSGSMLDFAQTLVEIGRLYYANTTDMQNRRRCLDLSVSMRNQLKNAQQRLDNTGFEDQIGILDRYIQMLGTDLALSGEESSQISTNYGIASPAPQRSLDENLDNLFHEILLEMKSKVRGTIAISGFMTKKNPQPQLVSLLNEKGLVEMSGIENLKVVERDKLDAVMREQKLSLSDLMDTTNAISVGKLVSARFILTGSVIEMPSSVAIFARIVNVETSEVESAAQVIVPRSPEVSALL